MNKIEKFALRIEIENKFQYKTHIAFEKPLSVTRNSSDPSQTLQTTIKTNCLESLDHRFFHHYLPVKVRIKKEDDNRYGLLDHHCDKEIDGFLTLRTKKFSEISSLLHDKALDFIPTFGLALSTDMNEIIEFERLSSQSKIMCYRTNNAFERNWYKGAVQLCDMCMDESNCSANDIATVYIGGQFEWTDENVAAIQSYIQRGGKVLWEGNHELSPTSIKFKSPDAFTKAFDDHEQKAVLYNASL